ncbi:MAG: DUF1828 domain-containing protein [Planctomycetaceae bacterium]|nr:DUF1828 domain-containing protein [Planctomycetaceae bacterium]
MTATLNRCQIQELNDQYFHWLRDNTVIHSLENGWAEITTPFLDRHNDSLQIYAKAEQNGIRLTDDGYTISDLQMSGCDLDSSRRQAILKETLAGFGVNFLEGRLEVFGNQHDFAQLKVNLLQAMLCVNDMFYLSSPQIAQLFFEDTASWLESAGIRYASNIRLQGKSGFSYNIFGLIPKSPNAPDRIIQPINRPDKNSVRQLLFEWEDTREARPGNILYPILNDTEKEIRQSIISAFESYGVTCIPWSQREDYRDLLAS